MYQLCTSYVPGYVPVMYMVMYDKHTGNMNLSHVTKHDMTNASGVS